MSSEQKFVPSAFRALASSQLDAQFAAARAEGYAEGYATGIRAAQSATRSLHARQEAQLAQAEASLLQEQARIAGSLDTAVAAIGRLSIPVLEQASTALASAALELAEQILGTVLDDRSFAARSALERSTRELAPAMIRCVRMNPGDLASLERAGSLPAGIALLADPDLQSGDAMAELEHGFLDARISTALQRAAAALSGGGS